MSNGKSKFAVALQTDGFKAMINNTLQKSSRAESFIASVTSAVVANEALNTCDPASILSAAFLGEGLNLSPSPQLGQYYIVPFGNSKTGVSKATFILGYKGYIQLAIRTGQYKRINVLPLKKGELINFNPFDETINVKLIENDIERELAETTGYYAMFELLNGFQKRIYWSKEKMENHALQFSATYKSTTSWVKNSSKWTTNFDDMACKTMLRQLISKWGIISPEIVTALENDGNTFNEQGLPVDFSEIEETDSIAGDITEKDSQEVNLDDL